jgi:hypothetical protein
VNDARSAADVVRRAQSEKLDWQNALTPINRELSQHYGGGEPVECQQVDDRVALFFREEILINAKVAQLAVRYPRNAGNAGNEDR